MSVASMSGARRNRGRRETDPAPAGPTLGTFIVSWQLSLEAAGKSPKTVRSYTDSVKALCAFLDAVDGVIDVLSEPARLGKLAGRRVDGPVVTGREGRLFTAADRVDHRFGDTVLTGHAGVCPPFELGFPAGPDGDDRHLEQPGTQSASRTAAHGPVR